MTLPGTFIIARHHESEWNKKGLWTGSRDVHLTPYGLKKSKEMGALLKDLPPDYAFASGQVRTDETLAEMFKGLGIEFMDGESSPALNERDYGDYTGKNKWDMKELVGEEAFERMRRDWNYPLPHGETLKMVYKRIVPFYLGTIVPLLHAGHRVLVVSHGNALRALMMYIESVPPEKAREVEMLFGSVVLYRVDKKGKVQHKEVRTLKSKVNA